MVPFQEVLEDLNAILTKSYSAPSPPSYILNSILSEKW